MVRATELNDKNICITNSGKLVLQIGAALLLQIRANVVTNWGSFTITNWGSYYKLRQPLLQIRAVLTNWGILITFLLPLSLSHVTFHWVKYMSIRVFSDPGFSVFLSSEAFFAFYRYNS